MARKLEHGKGRADVYKFLPEDVLIELDEAHPLYGQVDNPAYDQRMREPVDSAENLETLAWFEELGWRGTILANVITDKDTGEQKIVVTDGRRRTRMLRIYNQRLIDAGLPPLLMRVELAEYSAKIAKVVSIAMNRGRRSTPLERGHEIRALINEHGYDKAYIAEKFFAEEGEAPSLASIDNWIFLAGTHPLVQDAMRLGAKHPNGIGYTVVLETMEDVPFNKQPDMLERLIKAKASGKLTVKRAKNIGSGEESSDASEGGKAAKEKKGKSLKDQREILDHMERTLTSTPSTRIRDMQKALIAYQRFITGTATMDDLRLIDPCIPSDHLKLAPEGVEGEDDDE